jgi:hypothetical protein
MRPESREEPPELQRLREAREAHAAGEQKGPTPREALEQYLVNVVARIREGIPLREWVTGARGRLAKGKRHLIVASKKTGKSITEAVVTPLEVIAHGGVVAVLDRENGADEYTRRADAVLTARGADQALRQGVESRLRYYDWPRMRLEWGEDPDAYVEAFADVDLIIFDSSRSHTAALRLKENESDDYAAWMAALIDPLARAGKTVVVLDNSGHESTRARGTSSKEDLFDIVFYMTAPEPFSLTVAGRAQLVCEHSRIGELTKGDSWEMRLGAGHYGGWEKLGASRPPQAHDDWRDAAIEVLCAAGRHLGHERVEKAIREREGNTLRFDGKAFRSALKAWSADPTSGIQHDTAKGYFCNAGQLPLTPGGDHHPTPPGENSPPDPTRVGPTTPENPTATGDPPLVEPSTRPHPAQSGARNPPEGGAAATGGARNGTPADVLQRLSGLPEEEAEREWERLQAEQREQAL